MTLTDQQQKMVDQKVDHWKARLFDLSGRNRLLFFRVTKTTTINIRIPSPQDLFQRLVEKGSTLNFPLGDNNPPADGQADRAEPINRPLRENEIGSDVAPSGLTRTLYNLYSRSRTAREEQGINILFIGFGLLQWRDSARGEIANSPVILVPVELTREAPGKPYQLSMDEDDIVVNPTLKEALRQFYAIELNDLPDDLDKDGLNSYLAYVAEIAAQQKDWGLDVKAFLDLFSYQKQIIVADLQQNAPALKSNPLIVSMSIPGFVLPQDNLNLLTAQELDDKVAPQQVFQILDADSSQQEAIEAAKAGLSFVLQGPPGTGKSQTIANIIAEFLASGRNVLFVSAKMAALEVVQDRLKKAGLGVFCLQVHSHKRNKNEVIQELGQSLEIEPEMAPESVNARLDVLQKTRTNLNAYVRTLHDPMFKLGLSAYQAYGSLLKLRSAPDIKFTLPNLTELAPDRFESQKDIVEQLSGSTAVIQDASGHPWFGVRLMDLPFDKENEIENAIQEFQSNLETFRQKTTRLAAVYGVKAPENFVQSSDLFDLACVYLPAAMAIPSEEIKSRYEQRYQSFLRFLSPQYWKDAGLLARCSRSKTRPDPKKAIDDLVLLLKIQGMRLSSTTVAAPPLADSTSFEQNAIEDLRLRVRSGISAIAGLYLENQMPEIIGNLPLTSYDTVLLWLQNQLSQTSRLREWVYFNQLSQKASDLGVGNYVEIAFKSHLQPDQWLSAFLKGFYLLWINLTASHDMAFSNFNSQIFENNIDKFKELDREHIRTSKIRIREKLLQQRPKSAWMNAASSEEAILRREMNKKRRIKPLRRLFGEIPGLILRLRPCLMMSPLTVSQLLNPELYKFDLVIFDEASQIHPEEAVGAIFRGTQTIIVGDKHQLPPTSFFAVLDAGEDVDDETVVEDLESVLNEGEAAGLSNKMLRWHYRSKDESLIAFSNHNFYNDRLLTFPNADKTNANTGVNFLYLADGVYQRGGRRNVVEAARVVDLVIAHYQKTPNLSLGVVTFSQAQKDTIQFDLDQRLRSHPEIQIYFSDTVPEPAFVKNLELVQGDERDVMIFSVGYGHDETGKFIQNFGPLNNDGGERRLNVAVTRARQKVILVASIQPEDIDLSKTNSRGVKLLRSYMTLARDGLKSIYADLNVDEDADFDSPFEAAVYEALTNRGLLVKKQVGVSGYRIDLALIDPQQPGRFLLGIECDGAMYHSGATARDRDRLRQQVLEGLGWRIHRIWSRDWFSDPDREVIKVINALQSVPAAVSKDKVDPQPEPIVDYPAETAEPVTVNFQGTGLPDGVIFYVESQIPSPGQGVDHFYRASIQKIMDVIAQIVNADGPLEGDHLVSRVAHAWGIQRAGSRVKETVERAVSSAVMKGLVEKRGTFIWPKGMKTPVVRAQAVDGLGRDITQICGEETAEAVFITLREAISLERDDLVKSTARLYGLRSGGRTADQINLAIDRLIEEKRIEWRSSKLRIPM